MDYGFVYCLINESMPGLCKVGCVLTANKSSQERAKDLSSSTSCPTPFEVVYDIKVINPMKYERRIHDKIKSFRKNKNREFFYCDPEDIVQYFKMENLILSENEKINFCENYFQRYTNINTNILNDNDVNDIKNIIDDSNKNIEDETNNISKEKICELEIKNKIKL